LIRNAIKFSEAGSITVEAARSGKNPNQVEIRVKEKGVEQRDFSRIVDIFYHRESENLGGTGLGLAITRRLVESLGGSLNVENKPEEDLTWKIEIPRELTRET